MSDKSSIEWTDATWNPIRARFMEIQDDGSGKERIGWHCEHLSEGCRHCYAERINLRLGTGLEFKPGHLYRAEHEGFNNGEAKLFLDDKMLMLPLRWKKPRMIFVCSMTDLFADFVPDEWIDKVFAVMALSPQHTYQILSKRAARMRDYCTAADVTHRVAQAMDGVIVDLEHDPRATWRPIPGFEEYEASTDGRVRRDGLILQLQINPLYWPLPNCWLGVSTERQQEADERIPLLLQTPAAVRFISAEPLLGPIDVHLWMLTCPAIDWVIVGGESGPNARPMHPVWARSLRDQCAAAGVAFFFKQWGEWRPRDCVHVGREHAVFNPDGSYDQVGPGTAVDALRTHIVVERMGKKAAGRLLDGVEHNAMPRVRA